MAHCIVHSRVLAAALGACALAANALGGMEWLGWNHLGSWANGAVEIINDNPGAVYDSYLVKLEDLANQIWSNNPALHGTYSSAADLIANGVFTYGIDSKPTSKVAKGWNAAILPNGDVRITHITGIPNLSYDVWYSSPGTNMQRGSLSVAKTFLDLDGDGWTTNDLRIGNDTNQVVVGGVATTPGGFFITNTIARIVVVLPEREVSISSTHAWFGSSEVGNPTGAGRYAYGSAVTVAVDRVVADPANPGRRLRFDGFRVEAAP
ncbi:MAG: hypothetical protein PHI39_08930 [Kiritimatiellae bacterium]|nr:hypothetical protein [Kiritimatiellia bacterium]